MKSTLDSGSRGLGSSPREGHYTVFLGKTRYSQRASLYPGGQITGKFNPGGGNPAMENNPIQGELKYS